MSAFARSHVLFCFRVSLGTRRFLFPRCTTRLRCPSPCIAARGRTTSPGPLFVPPGVRDATMLCRRVLPRVRPIRDARACRWALSSCPSPSRLSCVRMDPWPKGTTHLPAWRASGSDRATTGRGLVLWQRSLVFCFVSAIVVSAQRMPSPGNDKHHYVGQASVTRCLPRPRSASVEPGRPSGSLRTQP